MWVIRIVGIVLVPVLVLLVLEASLRLFGYGVPTGFTYRQTVDGERRILSNPYFIWRFFPPQMAKEGSHFSRPMAKAEGVYRIFVLGGSAAQGVPDPAYGMTRMLDTMLSDQYPGVDFDVMNAAVTAINSHVVLPIAQDCRRMESDLFVIYLGNNEVVGPYGAGTVFSPLVSSLPMIRTGIALKATRLGQLVPDVVRRVRGPDPAQLGKWGGMAMFRDNQVCASDPGMGTVYRHFEKNLSDIFRVAQRSGIPVIVSTVGVNLKDCAPFASLHRPGLTKRAIGEFERIVKEGEALQELGDFKGAIQRFLEAEKIDAEHAELQFRIGRCYWAVWDFEEAEERYARARDLDTLRFRADRRINEIIKRVAGDNAGKGVHLVDSLKVLEANSPEHTPGRELFYEHVHLNFRGNYLVAKAVFEQVRGVVPVRVSRHAKGGAVLSERELARRMAYTGWSRLSIARSILGLVQSPPFTGQLYNHERVERMTREVADLEHRYTTVSGQQEALRQYEAALANGDGHWRLHHSYAEFLFRSLKNPQEAEKHLEIAIGRCPQSALEHSLLAEVLSVQGKLDEAEEHYHRALVSEPQSTQILLRLGTLMLRRKQLEPAIAYLRKAVKVDPLNGPAQTNLGMALTMRPDDGRSRREALGHLKRAVEIGPDHTQARENLAAFYSQDAREMLSRNEDDRAMGLLQQIVELSPRAIAARYRLAVLLDRQGDRKSALKHLNEVLRVHPSHREARELSQRLRSVVD